MVLTEPLQELRTSLIAVFTEALELTLALSDSGSSHGSVSHSQARSSSLAWTQVVSSGPPYPTLGAPRCCPQLA